MIWKSPPWRESTAAKWSDAAEFAKCSVTPDWVYRIYEAALAHTHTEETVEALETLLAMFKDKWNIEHCKALGMEHGSDEYR